jgi:hypothetical protein
MRLIVERSMVLSGRVRQKIPAIAERWLADALAAYPAGSAAAFRREKDPFANPVGHALRVGTRAAVEALLDGREAEEICAHLEEILKMRAVQEFPPSQAISFVFLLKEALRAELAPEGPDAALCSELAELERRIDRMVLGAFDVYVRHRARVYELRINEVKRNVARLMEMGQRRGGLPPTDEGWSQRGPLEGFDAERGGGR